MLKVSDFISRMTHALGKTPDSRHSLYDSLNQAGREFYSAAVGDPWFHEWSWVSKADFALTVPANASVVALPWDFGSPIAESFDSEVGGVVIRATQEKMAEVRPSLTDPARVLYLCYEAGLRQVNAHKPPVRVAEVWPVSSSARSDIRITYRRSWGDVSADFPDVVPYAPAEFEALFLLMACASAYENENRRPAMERERIARETSRLVFFDCQSLPSVVPVEHSAMRAVRERGANTADLSFDEIAR